MRRRQNLRFPVLKKESVRMGMRENKIVGYEKENYVVAAAVAADNDALARRAYLAGRGCGAGERG